MIQRERCLGLIPGTNGVTAVLGGVVLTEFPLVCGILICCRHVILGKSSRWKSCSQHRFQHHCALTLSLFLWHWDSHPGLCAEKAVLLVPGSQNLDLFKCKQNPGRKFENHLWVQRENCGCTAGSMTVCSRNNQENWRPGMSVLL